MHFMMRRRSNAHIVDALSAKFSIHRNQGRHGNGAVSWFSHNCLLNLCVKGATTTTTQPVQTCKGDVCVCVLGRRGHTIGCCQNHLMNILFCWMCNVSSVLSCLVSTVVRSCLPCQRTFSAERANWVDGAKQIRIYRKNEETTNSQWKLYIKVVYESQRTAVK